MDAKMDHGPILAQETLTITPDETTSSLEDRTGRIGIPLLIKVLNEWFEGTITPQAQTHNLATYTQMLNKESGKIDWAKNAQEIDAMVRALNPWPGTWTEWHGKRIKILRTQITQPSPQEQKSTDTFFTIDDCLFASCGNGEYLEILELQPEGKNAMSGASFIHGYLV